MSRRLRWHGYDVDDVYDALAMKLYEPIDVPKPIDRDLWIVDGPIVRLQRAIGSIPFPTRMVVARLGGGGLWIWSPVALSETLRANLSPLGPIRHLVSPNKIHYANVAAWKAAFPEAVAWASPGVRERARENHVDVTFDRDLTDSPDASWEKEMDQLIFRGSQLMEEVVFFHRASRTLILADLIENFEQEKLSFPERLLMRFGGVSDPDGKASTGYRTTFLGHRDAARKSLTRLLAWDAERIVIAHGRWYEHDAAHELRRAFRWLD